jgi:serine/threonine-protein kinase
MGNDGRNKDDQGGAPPESAGDAGNPAAEDDLDWVVPGFEEFEELDEFEEFDDETDLTRKSQIDRQAALLSMGGGDFDLAEFSLRTDEPLQLERTDPSAELASPPEELAPPPEYFSIEQEETRTLSRQRIAQTDNLSEYGERLSDLANRSSSAPPASISLFDTERPRLDSVVDEAGTHIWQYGEGEPPTPAKRPDTPIVANRYRIEERLAVGGMARIYLVRHLHLDKEFAMKIIAAELSAKPMMRKNFFREAKVASQMEHPNIVQVTDFGEDEQYGAYLVMEYLKGETLRQRLTREKRLRLPMALDIGMQVAEALHYIHEQNIIHCDIKSENIYLCEPRGEQRRRTLVKIIDFGLSKTKALGAKLARSEVGGTPHYMSPEQFSGIAPQPSMDIYSLGVLLYEMVVGQLPFEGDFDALVAAHVKQKPVPPSMRLGESLDERLDELIMKALTKDPQKRQFSMGQMLYEIRTLMDMLGFGKRRRRRKAVDRSPLPAVDEGRSVFDNCPCPQFRIDSELKIVVANAACCRFLSTPPEELVGMPLDITKLCFVYPSLRKDILDCIESKSDLQELITIKGKKDDAHLLLWFIQEIDETTGNTTFSGIILPQGS